MPTEGAGNRPKKRIQPITLSTLDKSILAELTSDPFASNASVASKVGVATSMVSSRLRILDRQKVSHVLAVLDLEHMRQSFCFIQMKVRGRAIAEVADDIGSLRLVLMVSELANGTADLLVLLRFDDVHCLNRSLYKDVATIEGVDSWTINIVIDVPIFRSEYITYTQDYLPIDIAKNLAYLRDDIPEGFCDDTDLQIIAHLQQNAHQSINDVARKVGLKPSTARYRINNLKSSEVLRFIRVLDNRSVGIATFALLELDVDVRQIETIIETLQNRDWLPQLFRCAGSASLLGIMLADGPNEVLRIRREHLAEIAGVREVKLTYLHDTRKIDFRWARQST